MSYFEISRKPTKAAKRHRCIWCGKSILPGSVYVREASKFDGDFQFHRWHPECDESAREYFASGEEEFSAWENERPPSAAVLEYESWDCRLLVGPPKMDAAVWAKECERILNQSDDGITGVVIHAIKFTRNYFGCTLKDGKDRVDALRQRLALEVPA